VIIGRQGSLGGVAGPGVGAQLQVWEAQREMWEAQLVLQGQCFRLVDHVDMGRMGGGVGELIRDA